MVDMLSLAGFDTLAAGSAAETIAIARQSSPDVILMDARLPEVDGFTTAQSLRDDPQTTHIPIVMVTAHATPEARELAEGAGCVGFVVKPFLPDDLIRAIERARRISSTTG